jgi:Kef-type K+ transport system membrane component KefB
LTTSELFLLAMLVILAVPFAVWRAAGRAGWAPLVVVQILGGILLGPGVLGAVAPGLHGAVFTPQVMGMLSGVALWAVVIFVFLAGMELDLSAAWADRRETALVAGLALAVPLALGTGVGGWLALAGGWGGQGASGWQVALGYGMACAVTALPILVLFLSELGVLRRPFGQRVLRYASLDDIAIWAVLALILLDWDRLGRQAAFVALFLPLAAGMRRLIPRLDERDRWPVALIWLAASALTSDWAGLHYMVGAFLAGAVLDAGWFGRARVEEIRGIVLMLLMPVFFLSTGLRTEWAMGGLPVIGVAVALLAAAVGGKLLGVALAGRMLGWPGGEALTVGWLLQTKALIMIVFANILLDKGVITGDGFTALLLMALASTMLTMPIVARRLR